MTIFSRSSWVWLPLRREPSPEDDVSDCRCPHLGTATDDDDTDWRCPHADDGDGIRRSGRRVRYTASYSDTTSQRTDQYSSQEVRRQASHGGRHCAAASPPRRTSTCNSASGPRPQHRVNTFWDRQRPPASERNMGRVEIAGSNNNNNNTVMPLTYSESEDAAGGSNRGSYVPRFRDVDIDFSNNNVEDISGGARAVTGFDAGRDFKARITNNRFGCLE